MASMKITKQVVADKIAAYPLGRIARLFCIKSAFLPASKSSPLEAPAFLDLN